MTEHVCAMEAMDAETWETEVREEIVRCRDCRHMVAFEQPLNLARTCCGLRGDLYLTDEDGFCHLGERRSDGNDR